MSCINFCLSCIKWEHCVYLQDTLSPVWGRWPPTLVLTSRTPVHWFAVTQNQARSWGGEGGASSAMRCCVSQGRWPSLYDQLLACPEVWGVSVHNALIPQRALTRVILEIGVREAPNLVFLYSKVMLPWPWTRCRRWQEKLSGECKELHPNELIMAKNISVIHTYKNWFWR